MPRTLGTVRRVVNTLPRSGRGALANARRLIDRATKGTVGQGIQNLQVGRAAGRIGTESTQPVPWRHTRLHGNLVMRPTARGLPQGRVQHLHRQAVQVMGGVTS